MVTTMGDHLRSTPADCRLHACMCTKFTALYSKQLQHAHLCRQRSAAICQRCAAACSAGRQLYRRRMHDVHQHAAHVAGLSTHYVLSEHRVVAAAGAAAALQFPQLCLQLLRRLLGSTQLVGGVKAWALRAQRRLRLTGCARLRLPLLLPLAGCGGVGLQTLGRGVMGGRMIACGPFSTHIRRIPLRSAPFSLAQHPTG